MVHNNYHSINGRDDVSFHRAERKSGCLDIVKRPRESARYTAFFAVYLSLSEHSLMWINNEFAASPIVQISN